jgi:hypothetical protein
MGSFQPPLPDSGASLFNPTTSNALSSNSVPTSTEVAHAKSGRGAHTKPAMQLALPTAQFIAPPPTCMFFSPSFRDLQKPKVAVWKGDLEIKGRRGGKFRC